ncbi:EI24 [Bugula neritina]|uniref:EI24 n=1 Tax=Bugula neritina TaxID=10212 RepID=A0A7J7IVK9_BUGNE|nr:EI24 [Bugula neritina]
MNILNFGVGLEISSIPFFKYAGCSRFTIGRFVNVIWFSQIANLAWKHSSKRSTNSLTIGLLVADLSFSVVMQLVFLVQCTLVGYLPLPFVAKKLSFAMVSLLYALYAFEYKWMNQGYSINVRLAKGKPMAILYGFGLPLAYLTSLSGNYFIDGSLFAVLFPLTIISAHQAQTLQQNFVFPLRLFGLSMVLSNHLFQGHEFIIKVGKFIFSLILSIATTTTFIVKNTVGRFLT